MLSQEVREKAESRVGVVLCDKWRLDRVIGVGGMAAVYQATHRNQNQVAIKLLHPQWSLDESTKRRFLREGYVANSIRHVGAVKILDDYADESGLAFLVMELLEGETLEARIERKGGQLEISDALRITDEVLGVLEAAHDQGVLHRDIKPDNIFVTRSGEVKILDFGIARLSSSQDYGGTKVGSFMGTPAYSAPEQARGHWDNVDARTDLYSVAATLFSLVTGRHVHEAETSSEQLALAISSRAPRLKEMMPAANHELAQLVDTGLQYAQDDRFQTSRAMRAEVLRTLAGLPHAPEVGPSSIPPSYDQDDLRIFAGLQTEGRGPSYKVRIGLSILAVCVIITLLVFVSTQNQWQESVPEVTTTPPSAFLEQSPSNIEMKVAPTQLAGESLGRKIDSEETFPNSEFAPSGKKPTTRGSSDSLQPLQVDDSTKPASEQGARQNSNLSKSQPQLPDDSRVNKSTRAPLVEVPAPIKAEIPAARDKVAPPPPPPQIEESSDSLFRRRK